MRSSSRSVRLAGQDLGEHRHVVALVEGPEAADELLMPFIVEGIGRGDRVVTWVDPTVRDGHAERLRAAGPALETAMASGQLAVATWSDSYLRGGRFDRSAHLEYLREILRDGRDRGFPMTRLIGSTEWAREAETVRDLLHYELRVSAMLRRLPDDVAVCTYDLNRHTTRTIAEVLAIHPVAIVGGVLQTTPGAAKAAPRERLLAAAAQLFHEQGIQATGVDALIDAAGIAKATFYRHFRSKDDLVVAWLGDEQTNWFAGVREAAEERATSPVEVIPGLFEAAAEWFEANGSRGCPHLNAAVEITDPNHPALRVVRRFLGYVEEQMTELVAAAGLRDPGAIGRQLQVLLSGAILQALAFGSTAPFEVGREAARSMIDAALPNVPRSEDRVGA